MEHSSRELNEVFGADSWWLHRLLEVATEQISEHGKNLTVLCICRSGEGIGMGKVRTPASQSFSTCNSFRNFPS